MSKQPFTSRDKVMRFIRRFWQRYNYAPTMQEIANALGFGSKETVRYHLRALRAQGIVEWTEGSGRTIRIREAV